MYFILPRYRNHIIFKNAGTEHEMRTIKLQCDVAFGTIDYLNNFTM